MHETTTQDPETLFRAATDFLRSRSPQTFDPWFAGVQFESLTDGVLALRARDEFIRAWVDEHFLPTLTDFLRGRPAGASRSRGASAASSIGRSCRVPTSRRSVRGR